MFKIIQNWDTHSPSKQTEANKEKIYNLSYIAWYLSEAGSNIGRSNRVKINFVNDGWKIIKKRNWQ